ncbi:exosome complex component RRP42-like [Atheta coriaria]|uniref:exosome complex component RRP42-like n=1 Tax=Dalotia coriaria TaxID=877792 RepID=UPI0031F3B484
MTLCEAEKTLILHGVEENFRIDGRENNDYRPMELETGIVASSFGSARLRLANTDVLVSVKVEVDVPLPDQPDKGKLEFFVDCSANATPDFEGRGGDNLATEISNCLTAAYKSTTAFDTRVLCIMKGRKCWKLYIDILLLECAGNLFDAVSLAVKSALWDTRIPKIKSVTADGNKIDMEVSDELYDCDRLNVIDAPIMVTVCKIGDNCIVDPSDAEEQCAGGSIVIAISKNSFSSIVQTGGGSLHPSTLIECLKMGQEVANRLDNALVETLHKITNESASDVGFIS